MLRREFMQSCQLAMTLRSPRYRVMFHKHEEQTPEPVKETIDEFCARRFRELQDAARLKMLSCESSFQSVHTTPIWKQVEF